MWQSNRRDASHDPGSRRYARLQPSDSFRPAPCLVGALAVEAVGHGDHAHADRQPSRRRLGLSHLPVVAIGITEVKPLDARAWAIQVILHVADLDALCFELVVRRVNM